MIYKNEDYKNGYVFAPSSTNEDLQEIIRSYNKVNCIICNSNTRRNFRLGILGQDIITINNKLVDGVFFINGLY